MTVGKRKVVAILGAICLLTSGVYLGYREGYIDTSRPEVFELRAEVKKCERDEEKTEYYRNLFRTASDEELRHQARKMYIAEEEIGKLAEDIDEYTVYDCTVILENLSTKTLKNGHFICEQSADVFVNGDHYMEPSLYLDPEQTSSGTVYLFIPEKLVKKQEVIHIRFVSGLGYGELMCATSISVLLDSTGVSTM